MAYNMIRRLEIDYFSCMDHSKPQIAMETRTVRIGPLPKRDGMNCSVRDPPANDTDRSTELLTKTKHPSTESLRANGAGNPNRPRTRWRPQPEPLPLPAPPPPPPPPPEKEQQQQQQQQSAAPSCAPRTTSSETERRISQLRRAGLSISSACSARSPPSSPRVVPLWKRPLRSFSSRVQREGPHPPPPPQPTALVPVDPVLGARPNYRGKRVSRKEYPDPTTCQWTFVGACEEQAVEAFEKDLGGGSIGVVQLEFEYTTGAFCVERRGDPSAFSEPRLVPTSANGNVSMSMNMNTNTNMNMNTRVNTNTNMNTRMNTNTNMNTNINATSVVLVPATTTRGGDRSLSSSLSSSLSPSRPPSPRTYRRMLLHPLEYVQTHRQTHRQTQTQTQTQTHHPSTAWSGEPDHETGPLGISHVITPYSYGR